MSTIIITGASRGIGLKTALSLAKEFDHMAVISRTCGENPDTVKAYIKSFGCSFYPYTGDVSDYGFVRDTVKNIAGRTGSIDVLINNAGISKSGLLIDTTPDEWQEMININLTSVYNTCHEVLPHMISQKSGKIINISSVWGLCGASCEVAYSATKGAINSFTKALAKELAPSGISVNAIAFGAVDTAMNSHLDMTEKAMLESEIPYGRMATVSEAACFIKNIIHMPSYFTGEVIKFDGGWT